MAADFSKVEGKMGTKRADNKFDLWWKGGKMDNYFKITERGSNMTTEIRAGFTTYLTAAYIMAVNPNILSVTGLNFEGLVFATAMSSFIATLIMALWANLPFGLWPGMGMNAYFAYTVVGFKGTQNGVKIVMFAVFIEGIIFIVISLLDLRRQIFKVFPTWLMKASMAGIGLFLAHIGLQAGNGIDLTRDHPAILVDLTPLNAQHAMHTWLGVIFFLVMATLVMLKVKGAVMIGILLSTFLCWILSAAGSPAFVYQPECCFGTVSYTPFTPNGAFFPKPGGGSSLTETGMPKPTCTNPYTLTGTAATTYNADGIPNGVAWTGESVVQNAFGNWTITKTDGTTVHHMGSLHYMGNGDGRNSQGVTTCQDVCMQMFGGFNPSCLPAGPPDNGNGPVLISTSCWTGLSFVEPDNTILTAMGATGGSPNLAPYSKIDGFGEGCIGGAGRIPKTFDPPKAFAAAPVAALAGDRVTPWFGAFGCGAPGTPCWAGDIQGGTFWAFDFSGITWENFGAPLLVLLYVDFIGTMAFLYAAADLSGLMNEKGDNFPGCYAAFMADAVGTCIGGLLGTSSVTTYGESMAGVYEGGRTGMTALTIAFFNFLSMFLAPFFSSIPTISTGPALVMVGVFMIEGVKDIDWGDYMQSIPSMLCILLQPVTYKIEVGVIAGLMTWGFMMIFSFRFALYFPSVWKSLPGPIKNFVGRQSLNAKEKAILEGLGYTAPAKAGTATAEA